ncbi:MAG TPA: extracellular solute-binding protein, partial [Candidatus Limnocylindrales bacterium]
MRTWTRSGAVLAVVAALALAGCGRDSGGDNDSGGGNISGGKASGEITVWAMGTEGEKLASFAEDFMKENPDAKVKVTPIPWDGAHDKIATAIAGRQTPDLSLVGTTWMGEFATLGGLDPTPANIDGSQFFEGAWNTTIVDGTSYAVPWYVETRLLYYRTDLAEEGGVTEPPATWDDLKALAEAIQGAGAEY